jgi:choline-sulfatase
MHWRPVTTDTGFEPLISREHWLESLPKDVRDRFENEHDSDMIRTTMGGPSPFQEESFFGPFLAQATNEFLEEVSATGDPFFAWVSIYEPHPPFFPPSETYRQFNFKDIRLPENREETGAPLPEGLRKRRKKWEHLTDQEVRQMMAGYFGLVEVADRAFGAILSKLETLGLSDNTWIVWTSDHGEQLYDHQLFLKFCMFEQSVHVPFAISGPGIQTRQVDHLVEHIDLFPTLCDLAGIETPPHLPGTSVVPHLRPGEGPTPVKDAVFSSIFQTHMIRTRSEKCVTIKGEPVQFYDLQKDPGEFHNAVNEMDCRERIRHCVDRLAKQFPSEFNS